MHIKTILCIKLWGLGNLAIIYPLLYKIKEKFPDSKLLFITFDINKGFLENNHAIDRVLYFKFTENIFQIIKQFFSLLIKLRREKIDLLINFETFNNVSALFAYLTKASLRIGLNNKYEKVFYNYPIYNEKSKHISQIFLSLLKPLHINTSYNYFNFKETTKAKNKIEYILKNSGVENFICIHPGTSDNFKHKRYKKENFSELANLLIDKYDFPVLFTGAPKEKDLIVDIIKRVSNKGKVFNLSNNLTIWEFIELLKKSALFISNDTGPVHIAASLGINMAVFYGPTSPRRFGPLNENSLIFYKNIKCSPCVEVHYIYKRCKNNFKCLDFPPKEILYKISEIFFNEQKN